MAKMFYTADEAAGRLQKTEVEINALVREGTLREFRDTGKPSYRIEDVEKVRERLGITDKLGGTSPGASASGEIVLEPVEESGISLSQLGSGSDILSLEEVDSEDTSVGAVESPQKKKEGTVIPSVGMNVFDDDELDQAVDPLAQTAVTDVAGMGIDGMGSGSGILDITRESDDTSLGAELLEEIYTGDEESSADASEDTRAGLIDTAPESSDASADEELELEVAGESAKGLAPQANTPQLVQRSAADPAALALTALMVVAVIVLWIGGLAGASLVRGVAPSLISAIHANLMIYFGGAVVVAVLASVVTYFLARRSG